MAAKTRRIHLLDELRGFAIILMVIHHFLYSLGYVFGVPFGREWFDRLSLFTPLFAGLFIFLCGFCCHLSKSNWLRGALLAFFAVGLSVVMKIFMPQEMIWFGILHCLACCILLYALLGPLLSRIPAWLGLLFSLLLFRVTYHVPLLEGGYLGFTETMSWQMPWSLCEKAWAFPLGFTFSPGSDYFPLLPWLFLFLAGSFAGRYASRLPAWTCKRHIRPLSFIGRHTIWVYLAHQPIIYAVLWLWFNASYII